MKENKLVELSMDFSVDIIKLVKFLKSNHETIIANQIGRSGTSLLERIFTKHNTHKAQRILYRNLKSRSRKQVKRDIGLNCFIVQNISMSRPSKHYLQNVLL